MSLCMNNSHERRLYDGLFGTDQEIVYTELVDIGTNFQPLIWILKWEGRPTSAACLFTDFFYVVDYLLDSTDVDMTQKHVVGQMVRWSESRMPSELKTSLAGSMWPFFLLPVGFTVRINEHSSTSLPRRAKLSHTGKFWRSGFRKGKTIIIMT